MQSRLLHLANSIYVHRIVVKGSAVKQSYIEVFGFLVAGQWSSSSSSGLVLLK